MILFYFFSHKAFFCRKRGRNRKGFRKERNREKRMKHGKKERDLKRLFYAFFFNMKNCRLLLLGPVHGQSLENVFSGRFHVIYFWLLCCNNPTESLSNGYSSLAKLAPVLFCFYSRKRRMCKFSCLIWIILQFAYRGGKEES